MAKKKPANDEQGELLKEPKAKAPPAFLIVPAGTVSARCWGKHRGGTCEKGIYWITYTRRGTGGEERVIKSPIDCSVDGGLVPTASQPGRGVSHYTTCPDTALFHKHKK